VTAVTRLRAATVAAAAGGAGLSAIPLVPILVQLLLSLRCIVEMTAMAQGRDWSQSACGEMPSVAGTTVGEYESARHC
jgi:hypothetical protein